MHTLVDAHTYTHKERRKSVGVERIGSALLHAAEGLLDLCKVKITDYVLHQLG